MGFTVAGTAPDFHRIPFYARPGTSLASPNRLQKYRIMSNLQMMDEKYTVER